MSHRVDFAGTARRQLRSVQRWWRANRRAAPELFKQELRRAIEQLRERPSAAPAVEVGRPGVRRLLLPRTRYHLYFRVDEAEERVRVLAVWHTARGHLPPLDDE